MSNRSNATTPIHLWPTTQIVNPQVPDSTHNGVGLVEPPPPFRMHSPISRQQNNYVASPHKLLPKPAEPQFRDSSVYEEVPSVPPPQLPFEQPATDSLPNNRIEEPPIEMVGMIDEPDAPNHNHHSGSAEPQLEPFTQVSSEHSSPEHCLTADSGTEPDPDASDVVYPSAPPLSLRFSAQPPTVAAVAAAAALRQDIAVDTSEVEPCAHELEPLRADTETAADTSPEPLTSSGEHTPSFGEMAPLTPERESSFQRAHMERRLSQQSWDTLTRMQLSTMMTSARRYSSRSERSERSDHSCRPQCSKCAPKCCCTCNCSPCRCCCQCPVISLSISKYVPEMPCACLRHAAASIEPSDLQRIEDRLKEEMGTGAFKGLTQAELELLVHSSRGWMWARFSLYWAFWIALLAIFVAAVTLVVVEPSCPYNPEMYDFQTGLVYRLSSALAFRDSDGDGWGDWDGITEGLSYLHSLGTRVLVIGPIARAASANNSLLDSVDLLATHSLLGNRTAFKRLLDEAHKMSIAVFVELNINFVSLESPIYKEFISTHTRTKDAHSLNYTRLSITSMNKLHPSNWHNRQGDTAFVSTDSQKHLNLHAYYQQYGKPFPELNLRTPSNSDLVDAAVDYILDLNADGILLKDASFLFESDPKSCIEQADFTLNFELPFNQFEILNHTCVLNQPESYELVARIAIRVEQFDKNTSTSASTSNTSNCSSTSSPASNPTRTRLFQRKLMVEASGSVAQIVDFAQYVWNVSDHRSSVHVLHDRLSSRRAAICNSSCLRDEIFDYVAEVDKVSGRVDEPYRALHTLFEDSSRDNVSLWPLWQTSSKEHGRASTRFGPALGRLLNALAFLLPGSPVVYYGDEIGMRDVLTLPTPEQLRTGFFEPRFRRPMRWTVASNFSNIKSVNWTGSPSVNPTPARLDEGPDAGIENPSKAVVTEYLAQCNVEWQATHGTGPHTELKQFLQLQRLRNTTGAFRWGFFVPLKDDPPLSHLKSAEHLLAFLRVGHGYGHQMHRHSYLVLANLSPNASQLVSLPHLFERHSAQIVTGFRGICDCGIESVSVRSVNGSADAKTNTDSSGNRLVFTRLPHPELTAGRLIDPKHSLHLSPTQLLVLHLELTIQ